MQKRVHALETNRPPPAGPAGKYNHGISNIFNESPARRTDGVGTPCRGDVEFSTVHNAANPKGSTARCRSPIIVHDGSPTAREIGDVEAQQVQTTRIPHTDANCVINLVTDSEGDGENPNFTTELHPASPNDFYTHPNIVSIDDDARIFRSQQGQGPAHPLRTPVISLRSPRLLERLQASQEVPDKAQHISLQNPLLFSASAMSSEYGAKSTAHMGYAARVEKEIEANLTNELSPEEESPPEDRATVNLIPVAPPSPIDRNVFSMPHRKDGKSGIGKFWLNGSDSGPTIDGEDDDTDTAAPVHNTKHRRLGRLRRLVDCSSAEENDEDQSIARPSSIASPLRRSPRFRGSGSTIPTHGSIQLNEPSLSVGARVGSKPEEGRLSARRSPRFSQVTKLGETKNIGTEMTPTRKSPRFTQISQVVEVTSDRKSGVKPVVIAGVAVSDDSGSDVEKSAIGHISHKSLRAKRRKNTRQISIADAERQRNLRLLGYSFEGFDCEEEETSPSDEIKPPSRQTRRTRMNACSSEHGKDIGNIKKRPLTRRRRRIFKNASSEDDEDGSSEEEAVPLRRQRRVSRRTRSTTRNLRQNFGYRKDDFIVEDGEESEESDSESPPLKRRRKAGNESENDVVMQVSSSSSSDSELLPRTEVESEHARQVREAMHSEKVPRGLQHPIICYICRLQGNSKIGTPQNGWRDGWIQPVHNFSVNVQKGNYGVRMTVPFCLMHTAGDQNRYIEQLQDHVTTTKGEAREEGFSAPRGVQNLEPDEGEDEKHSEGWRDYAEDLDSDDDDFIVLSSDV